jgi:adenosylmethionine-8-amino-7-oxononanoate aminotransferase
VAQAFERLLAQEDPRTVAAFIGEPVLGLAGTIAPPARFWREITEVCRLHGILVVADEVAMGCRRTGGCSPSSTTRCARTW